ncbi:MAG: T9SS C-terminal target domain-containing protein [Bacteroidia bacterium]
MKKILSTIILFFGSFYFSFSQTAAPGVQWEKALGGTGDDKAFSIHHTADKGYIVAGYSTSLDKDVKSNHGDYDMWVLKLDSIGTIQWQKSLGGSSRDEATAITQTLDGHYILVGSTFSTDGDIKDNHGSFDIWAVKMNATGNIIWQRCLGGSSIDEATDVQVTRDGGCIISGFTKSTNGNVGNNHGLYDFWLVKLSSTGNLEWEKSFGGSSDDKCYSIKTTMEGGFIVAGHTKSIDGDISNNHGGFDAWLVCLTKDGDIKWEKTLGGTEDDGALSIEQTNDRGFIMAGFSKSDDGDVEENRGYTDFWVVKLNSAGGIEWQKTLGGLKFDYATGVKQTDEGGYVVIGQSNSSDEDVKRNHGGFDFWVVKLAKEGAIQWQKSVGQNENDEAYDIQQTKDRGYVIAGYSRSSRINTRNDIHEDYDYWIVKLYGNRKKRY